MVGDAELAIAAAAGDRSALGQIYERYSDTLYELCRVILRDPHEASDALHDTFVIAATRLDGLRDKDRLKPWLCAIARHEAMRRSSKRARNRPSHDAVLDMAVADDTADRLFGDDAANLVWSAAESLTDRERTLLELNVRQGLEGADLAEAAGLAGATASVVLSRAKTQLATAVRCTLLVRFGRDGCAELASIAPPTRGPLDALTRKRVARHAVACENCEPRWNSTPDALGVLAVAPVLGAPAALRGKVLDDPRLISTSKPLGGRGWKRNGFPPAVERGRRRPIVASLAAALLIGAVATVLVLVANDDDTRRLAEPDARSTTTDAAGSVAVTTAAPVTTRPGGRPTTTRAGVVVTPTTVAATTTTVLHLTESISATQLSACHDTTSVDRTAVRADAMGSTPSALWVHITGTQGISYQPVRMASPSDTGGPWLAQLGPFDVGDTLTVLVSNSAGSGGTKSNEITVTVVPCPQ